MSSESLLVYAARVEAAIKAYAGVRAFTDEFKWRANLDRERKNVGYEFNRLKDAGGGNPPDIHPTLLALFIVMKTNGDLEEITKDHPRRQESRYWKSGAVFPADLAPYLPPRGERWWENLANESRNLRARQDNPPVPPQNLPSRPPSPQRDSASIRPPPALPQELVSPSELPSASLLPTLPLRQSPQSVPPAASLPSSPTGSLPPQPHTARSELSVAGKQRKVRLLLPRDGGKNKNASQRSPPDVERNADGEEEIEEEDGENGEEDDDDENDELDSDNDTTMRNAASLSQPTAPRGHGRGRGGGGGRGRGKGASRKRKNSSPATREQAKRRAHESLARSKANSGPAAPGHSRASTVDNPGPGPEPSICTAPGPSGRALDENKRGSGLESGGDSRAVSFECDRCKKKQKPCIPSPTGACEGCRLSKQKCSLTVHDASGVPVKTQVSEEEVRKYRLDLLRKKEKGKEPAQNPPEEEEQPAGMEVDEPSPWAALTPPAQEPTAGCSGKAFADLAKSSASGSSHSRDTSEPSAASTATTTTASTAAASAASSSAASSAVAGSSFSVEVPGQPRGRQIVQKQSKSSLLGSKFDPASEARFTRLESYVDEVVHWKREMEGWTTLAEGWMRNFDRDLRKLSPRRRR